MPGMNEHKDIDMDNSISRMANHSFIASTDNLPTAAPSQSAGGQFKPLYGAMTEDLRNVMNQAKQFAATAEALVSSRNPALQ